MPLLHQDWWFTPIHLAGCMKNAKPCMLMYYSQIDFKNQMSHNDVMEALSRGSNTNTWKIGVLCLNNLLLKCNTLLTYTALLRATFCTHFKYHFIFYVILVQYVYIYLYNIYIPHLKNSRYLIFFSVSKWLFHWFCVVIHSINVQDRINSMIQCCN